MVGRLVSFWDGLFSGATLVPGRVSYHDPIQLSPQLCWKGWRWQEGQVKQKSTRIPKEIFGGKNTGAKPWDLFVWLVIFYGLGSHGMNITIKLTSIFHASIDHKIACFFCLGGGMWVSTQKYGKTTPNHPFVHRVWNHYFHHPFLGYPYFWKHPCFGWHYLKKKTKRNLWQGNMVFCSSNVCLVVSAYFLWVK